LRRRNSPFIVFYRHNSAEEARLASLLGRWFMGGRFMDGWFMGGWFMDGWFMSG
jgi:hypothetical protein